MDEMIEIRPGRHLKIRVQQQANKEAPTLFFIHGLGGRGAQWREQVRHFQNDYNLIVPDLLGQGDSDKPLSEARQLYSFLELLKDLEALFDRYAGSENLLLGHSYGGALASVLALAKKERVKKLMLIAPLSCQPFKQVPLMYFLPANLLEVLRPYLDSSFERMAFAREDQASLLLEERAARALNQMAVIKPLLMGMREIPALDPKLIDLPLLIVEGEQDGVIPNYTVAQYYGSCPQQQSFILKQASHMVHLEQSQAVNELVAHFIRS